MALKDFKAAWGNPDQQEGTGAARQSADRPPRTVAPPTSIDSTSEFEGTLRCKGTFRIDGRVKGHVECDKAVIIGESGKVHASVAADTVQISGEVKGNITARRKITLDRTACVVGELATPGIVIEEGAKLEGRIVIGEDEKITLEAKPAEITSPEAKRPAPARTAPKAAAPPPA